MRPPYRNWSKPNIWQALVQIACSSSTDLACWLCCINSWQSGSSIWAILWNIQKTTTYKCSTGCKNTGQGLLFEHKTTKMQEKAENLPLISVNVTILTRWTKMCLGCHRIAGYHWFPCSIVYRWTAGVPIAIKKQWIQISLILNSLSPSSRRK